jgi:amino-acid N-acetyltransferase
MILRSRFNLLRQLLVAASSMMVVLCWIGHHPPLRRGAGPAAAAVASAWTTTTTIPRGCQGNRGVATLLLTASRRVIVPPKRRMGWSRTTHLPSPHLLLYSEMSSSTSRSTTLGGEEDDELDALDRILDQNMIIARAASNNRTTTTSSATNNSTDDDNGGTPPSQTSTDLLAIDPQDIIMVQQEQPQLMADLQQDGTGSSSLRAGMPDFVPLFRGSANYIANHRNTVAVYHIPGALLPSSKDDDYDTDTTADGGGEASSSTSLRDLMNDIALTWLLGMQIVLVAGCRTQVRERLDALSLVSSPSHHHHHHNHNNTSSDVVTLSSLFDDRNNNHINDYNISTGAGGTTTTTTPWLRVTDANELRIVKEEAGYVRFELERELARALRLQSGAGGTGMASSSINTQRGGNNNNNGNNGNNGQSSFYEGNVVSGNFYSAQPLGVQNGVDYKYTGFVRRIEVEKIRQVHAQRDICLLSALGVSPSGEVFNVNAEALAATTAGALGAKKVIYFTEAEMSLRHRVHANKIQCLRLSEARNLLKHHHIQMNKKGFAMTTTSSHRYNESRTEAEWDMLLKIGWCCEAIALGVKRAHIISPQHGALLQELYTRDGSGTLISADLYEGIRQASVLDVSKIHALIIPLIEAGTLIDRPKAVLEKDIEQYYVYTRDNTIVACGQLKEFENGFAEIGCLVVNKDFRSAGRGDAMLGYLERLCLRRKCNKVFVLSTQTMEWFVERGFDEADVLDLPPSRQQTYNSKRKSKIYLKEIESDRDLDASELFWT